MVIYTLQIVERAGTPNDLGHIAVFLADHNKASYFTGHCMVVDGGQHAKIKIGRNVML